MNKDKISVGKLLNFHGIKGEAKVGFSDWELFSALKEVVINDTTLKIVQSRRHKNHAIVKFAGIDTLDGILAYKGAALFAERETVQNALGADEFLVDELTGADAFDENGVKLGVVTGVSNNGASDLLSVKTKSGKTSLVPFVKAIVTGVNIKEKRITLNNIEGLLS